MSSSKPSSGIEHQVLISKDLLQQNEAFVKETIAKNDTLHASILHCALRKKEESATNNKKSTKKKAGEKIVLNHTNTQPVFVFVFGQSGEEIVELISNHVTEENKKNQENPPKKPFFYYYAASVMKNVDNSSLLSNEVTSKLSQLFLTKEQLAQQETEESSSSNNNKTLLLASPFKNRDMKRKHIKTSSSNNNNQEDQLLLQTLLLQQQQQQQQQQTSSTPKVSDFFWSTLITTSTNTEAQKVSPASIDDMWTACLDAAHLSTLVGFWYGSHAGNAEYICSQIHHMFVSNERVGTESTYSSPHAHVRDFLEQSNSVTNFQSQLILFDTLNSFVKKEMMSPLVVQRYTCVHIFVCSTHGDGDFPDNASRTKRYVIKIQSEVANKTYTAIDFIHSSFFFSVLALGDTNYSKFAEAGQLLNRKLKESGATCFKPIECPDDGIGLELVVDPYLKEIWAPFEKQLNSCLKEMSSFADEISSCRRENKNKGPEESASSSSSSPTSVSNAKNIDKNAAVATSSSSSPTTTTTTAGTIPQQTTVVENTDGKYYEVSTVILFAPSALMHAGALQSVLVNAGLHGANSLPILLPLRAFAPLMSSFGCGDDDNNDKNSSSSSPLVQSQNQQQQQQQQRLPCPKNLFVIASSDCTWWDSEDGSDVVLSPVGSSNDITQQQQQQQIENKSKWNCKKSCDNSELAKLSSRVKTFAYFDIEECLCKQQQKFQECAGRAFCLPKSAEFLSAFSSAIIVPNEGTNNNNNNNTDNLRCAFTSWLRALARWLIPRTLQDSPGFVSALTSSSSSSSSLLAINNHHHNNSSTSDSKEASATSTIVSRISDAVNSIVDGVIHGHHERGMLVPPVLAATGALPNQQQHHHQYGNFTNQKSTGEALHILSLKRTVVFFSKNSVDEQQPSSLIDSHNNRIMNNNNTSKIDGSNNANNNNNSNGMMQGQSLAEDVARGIVATSLRGLDVEVAEVGCFKTAGFPRKAVFVFVVGPDSSKGVRRLINYIQSILATTNADMIKKKKLMITESTTNDSASTPVGVVHPFRGLSFTIFGIDWLHRSSQEYGGALELELLLQEAGATKIHPTGLARTGTIDAGISRWRKNLKHNIEICGPVNGYIESHPTQQVLINNNKSSNGTISPSLMATSRAPTATTSKDFSNFTLDNHHATTNSSSGFSSAASSTSSSSTSSSSTSSSSASSSSRSSSSASRSGSSSSSSSSDSTSSVSSPNEPNSNNQFPKLTTATSNKKNNKIQGKNDHRHHNRKRRQIVTNKSKINAKTSTTTASTAVAELIASSSWEPWISIRPTPASLTAKTSVSIVVALSLTGFAKWIARKCANEARILGYNVAFVGSIANAEDFLSLPTGFVVILCGMKSPKKLLRGLVRLHATQSDVLSHLSFGCLGVVSSGNLFANNNNDQIIINDGDVNNNNNKISLTPPIGPSSPGISPTAARTKSHHHHHQQDPTPLMMTNVTIPGVEVASHLELCGSQRVFPSAAIDSPSGAETKGLLWLRGVLTAFSRITARRQFFLNQQNQLPSLPSPTSATATLLASLGTPEQQKQHAKKKSITFIFTSALTQMMARDMAEEASARNFAPARLLPFTAFREIMDPADGICAAVVVFLCDETTPSGSRTISRFTAALNKSSVLRNATESCVCVLGVGDRSSPTFTSHLMNQNNNNDDDENNTSSNSKIIKNKKRIFGSNNSSHHHPVCPMCPMTSGLAAVVEKYMKPLTSEDHQYASSLKTVDTSDPNVILSIQGFRDDFFYNAVENYKIRTKPFLTSQNLSLLNNNDTSNNNNSNTLPSTSKPAFYFEDHPNNNDNNIHHDSSIDGNRKQGDDGSIATTPNEESLSSGNNNNNNNNNNRQNKSLTFNDKKNIVIDENRHPNDSVRGTSDGTRNNNIHKNEDSVTNKNNNKNENIDFSATNGENKDKDSLDTDHDLRKNHVDDDEMDDLANEWFTGQIVEAQTLTSEVTKPPVIFMLFKVFRKGNHNSNGNEDNNSNNTAPSSQQQHQQQVVWTPGDAIQILPENNSDEVEEILNLLQVKGDEEFLPPNHHSNHGKKEEESRFPSAPVYRKLEFPVTRRDVLKKFLSLKIHNSQVCLMMEKFVTEPRHRAILREVLDFISGSSSTPTVSKKNSSKTIGGGADPSSSSSALLSNANNNNNNNSKLPSSSSDDSPSSSLSSLLASSKNNTPLTLIEVLRQIKESVKFIPFRGFVETLPLLQPRCYSITTAHSSDPDHIGIAFKVVKNGVCTQWLQNLAEEHQQLQQLVASSSSTLPSSSSSVIEIPLRLRLAPEFRMPEDLETPMILIGPGTGVAPFMSFLSHREAELQSLILDEHQYRMEQRKKIGKKENENGNDNNQEDEEDENDANNNNEDPQQLLRHVATEVLEAAGAINLYFGCRSKYHDYLFEGDLVEWKQAGVLSSLNVAFSQDSNGGVWFGGLYVQDLLREAGLELCRMILEQHAHVYVCGDASSMAKDVHQVLLDILMEFRGMSQVQAQKQLKHMEENGAYQRDIWG